MGIDNSSLVFATPLTFDKILAARVILFAAIQEVGSS
jgi:hypothetical protein